MNDRQWVRAVGTIELGSNPSTGYSWKAVSGYARQTGWLPHHTGPEIVVGGGGVDDWYVEPRIDAPVVLEYAQHWNAEGEPVARVTITVEDLT